MGHATTSIDGLGEGIFRKVRQALGVTAFGVNVLVLPPRTSWFEHAHDEQDELYFVHHGRAGAEVAGERFQLDEGGLCHVEAQTRRRFWNAGDDELVLLIVGGKDGYVGRDGRLAHPEDEERRRAVANGDHSVIAIGDPETGR